MLAPYQCKKINCKKLNLTQNELSDDLIIFTDGSGCSLSRIVDVLKEFQSESSLAINMEQLALYMAGCTHHDLQEKATQHGIPVDQLQSGIYPLCLLKT